jgi:hypothetical protein
MRRSLDIYWGYFILFGSCVILGSVFLCHGQKEHGHYCPFDFYCVQTLDLSSRWRWTKGTLSFRLYFQGT